MIGRQRAAPGKCISSNSLSRAESDAGRSLSTSIVDRITELDSPTRAIECNVNGSCIGNNYRSTAGQSLNGCGAHRHINVRDLELRRRALPRWPNQWRSQLIGAGHLDTASLRVRMVERQRATPRKCVGSNSLSRAEGDAGRSLSTPIVNRVAELNGPTRTVGCNMNGGRIGHNYRSTTRHPLNGCRTHRHINFRDLKRRQRCTLSRWPNE